MNTPMTTTSNPNYRFRHWGIVPVCMELQQRLSGSNDAYLGDLELKEELDWLRWRLENWIPGGGRWQAFDECVRNLIVETARILQEEQRTRG